MSDLKMNTPGILSDKMIKQCMKDEEIVIYPFEDINLTPAGYNLSASDFILSINTQLLVNIHYSNTEKYCYIDANDTVLIMTREAIKVSNTIAGSFHSRVSVVSKGFGHISTTLDPSWQGPLLISLNNPTKKKLKLTLGSIIEKKEKTTLQNLKIYKPNEKKIEHKGNKVFVHRAFVTLVLKRLSEEPTQEHNNPSGRFDILKSLVDLPLKRRFWLPWKKRKNHFLKLKQMIDEIGSLSFVKNPNKESNNEVFVQNYEAFSKTLEFYTKLAREASVKIVDQRRAWSYAKVILRVLLLGGIIGFILSKAYKGMVTGQPATVTYYTLTVTIIAVLVVPYMVKPIVQLFEKGEKK
ncbi:dCTP deaminase domain-containing protein [Peribacillus simplex]|uniref:dCTP deaminase domain-containing protein n=1 Tax=Peribacillus simplex TaxID=1478 RepID=UPI0024C14DB4|nr:hypothetical protein [Peribacillus simplex]WHY97351.1 hypothetical protein QNH37_26060 [Peribacillus simplex]